MAKAHTVKTVQFLPINLNEAWDFFSNPSNLEKITPTKMGFNIISTHHGSVMYAGQIIEYNVKPLMGIPLYWMTEITQVVPKKYFIDEQRFGPYTLWHHQHHFTEVEGGVEMTDIVHYKLPLGFIGRLTNNIFVKKQLNEIFQYRFKKAEELFKK
jgi:ligand-binding SRPBCC domain-containing protein